MVDAAIQLSDDMKDLVDPPKLAKLPEPLLNVFSTLSKSQAKALFGVFLKQAFLHRHHIEYPDM
jgi:hypothetical protein